MQLLTSDLSLLTPLFPQKSTKSGQEVTLFSIDLGDVQVVKDSTR
jgi:hypothetical protein